MPCEELDIVWKNIKAEARALAECEPMLASFYHATLLKHRFSNHARHCDSRSRRRGLRGRS